MDQRMAKVSMMCRGLSVGSVEKDTSLWWWPGKPRTNTKRMRREPPTMYHSASITKMRTTTVLP